MNKSTRARRASRGKKARSSRGRSGLGRTLAALVLLALAALAAYHKSFSGPFIFDDRTAIVENPDIRHFATTLREDPQIDTSTAVGRPLLRVSLWINYAWGGQEVRGYHVLNLVLHILAAWTLWGLARRILESPPLRDRYGKEAWGLALAIALLWTVHPLQTESVTYVVQRAEILGGWFYLLTLYSVVRSASAVGWRVSAWSVAAVASCLLGMASKETAATAPLLALALDRVFFAPSWKRLWELRRGLYGALACTWIFQALLVVASSGRKGTVGFGLVHWWEYALTQPYYLCRYLALSVWPSALTLDYGTYLARTVGEVAPYAAVVLLLLALTFVGLWRKPALGFCGLWFFLILAPTSSVVPIATQTGAEHRMYLPLAGLIGLGVVGGYTLWRWAWRDLPGRLWVGSVLVLAVGVTALGARTVARNEEYRSEVSIWRSVVDRWPINPRAHNNLGSALSSAGRTSGPEAALRLEPNFADAHYNLEALASAAVSEPSTRPRCASSPLPGPQQPGKRPREHGPYIRSDRPVRGGAAPQARLRRGPLQPGKRPRERGPYVRSDRPVRGRAASQARLTPRPTTTWETPSRTRAVHQKRSPSTRPRCVSSPITPRPTTTWEALASAGRTSEAIAQLEEALRLKPDLAGGHIPEAIAELKDALLLQQERRRSGLFWRSRRCTLRARTQTAWTADRCLCRGRSARFAAKIGGVDEVADLFAAFEAERESFHAQLRAVAPLTYLPRETTTGESSFEVST